MIVKNKFGSDEKKFSLPSDATRRTKVREEDQVWNKTPCTLLYYIMQIVLF